MTPEDAKSWLEASEDGFEPDLETVCDALATVAGLRYEYAVQGLFEYWGEPDKWRFLDYWEGEWEHEHHAIKAEWWDSAEDALAWYARHEHEPNCVPRERIRVVRRLVSEPEVVE